MDSETCFLLLQTNKEMSEQKINCKKSQLMLPIRIMGTYTSNNIFFLLIYISVMEEVKKEQIDTEDPLKLPLENVKKEIFEPSTG